MADRIIEKLLRLPVPAADHGTKDQKEQLADARGEFWINEALDLHRRTEAMEKETTRRFTSRDIAALAGSPGAVAAGHLAGPPGLAAALELERKLRKQGK